MPVRMLVATTTHRKQIKGEVIACMPDAHVWGGKEGLPNYVEVRVTDATPDQVVSFLEKWNNAPDYAVAPAVLGRVQITVTVPTRVIDIFGDTKGLKAGLKTDLENNWSAIVTVLTPNRKYIVDVPEPTDLAALKSSVADAFEEALGPRWIFDPARVDQAVALGGSVERTKIQAQADLIDRTL